MKKLIAFTVILGCIILTLASCGGGGGSKQVPVYQGMTISSAGRSANAHTLPSLWAETNNGNGNDGDSGNHYGQYKGDHDGRNDQIDEENPFPDNSAGENIEEEIESSLNVTGPMHDIYYATPNEDIYIYIHIDNPDSFEIMSFTLNGKKYSSYMFEDGSDMETIILKYNVGNTSGYVEYTIDAIKYIDGTEIKDVIINGDKTVRAGIKTENQVATTITDLEIGTNSISFVAEIEDNDQLIALSNGTLWAVIYDGENVVAKTDVLIGKKHSITFDGLMTNTLYQYAIVGYYDDLSGGGFGMYVLHKDAFYTDSVVLFSDITVGQENISFGFSWHKNHENKSLTSLKLYKDGSLVKELDTKATSIDGLLCANTYSLVASYSNLGNTESISIEFTTLAKAEPSLSINNEVVDTNSIQADLGITDADGTLIDYNIELYKGEKLVIGKAKEINFTSLDYYTNYTVKITYSYDLNDGDGKQTKTIEKSVTTLPYIDVTGCNIANTSAVSEGDTIFMQVTLDNPLNMTIESVVINGETYTVSGASTTKKIFVEIVYNGQFEGGNTYLKIDKVNAKIGDMATSVAPKSELSDNVFINGKLEALKVEYVNESFEPIDWAFPSDKVYMLVTLDNATGYNIDKAEYSLNKEDSLVNSLIKIDDDHWYIEVDTENEINYIRLVSITYSNSYLEKTVVCDIESPNIFVTASDEIIYISTPDDLKNMSSEYYYELTNDIDLSGLEWKGSEFHGVFNGNGYSIKNMSFVGSVNNTNAYLGLFSEGRGIIQNLNLENATIIADLNADEEAYHTAYVGGFVAYTTNINLYNCTVDEYSIFSIRNNTDVETSYAGGLVGGSVLGSVTLTECENNASITALGRNGYAGGLIGSTLNSRVSINNCINNGNVTSEQHFAGGLVSETSRGTISNSINTGSVTSSDDYARAGGIAGFGDAVVVNCINTGEITAIGDRVFIGGIVGECSSDKIVNSYSLSGDDASCTIEQLNTKSFYTETLGWSEDVWDFSDLDVENGKYPNLR